MLDIGTKVLIQKNGMNAKVWGLDAQPTGEVVDHLHDVFNVVVLNLREDPEGIAKGPSSDNPRAVPGWLFLDEELEVLE